MKEVLHQSFFMVGVGQISGHMKFFTLISPSNGATGRDCQAERCHFTVSRAWLEPVGEMPKVSVDTLLSQKVVLVQRVHY